MLLQEALRELRENRATEEAAAVALLKTKLPERRVCFLNEDLSSFPTLQGATHLYSFDAAMDKSLIN